MLKRRKVRRKLNTYSIAEMSSALSQALADLPPDLRGKRFSAEYEQTATQAQEREEFQILLKEQIREIEEALWAGQRLYTYATFLSIEVNRLYRADQFDDPLNLYLICGDQLEKVRRTTDIFRKEAWDIGRNRDELPSLPPQLNFGRHQAENSAETNQADTLAWACTVIDLFNQQIAAELETIKAELIETRRLYDELTITTIHK